MWKNITGKDSQVTPQGPPENGPTLGIKNLLLGYQIFTYNSKRIKGDPLGGPYASSSRDNKCIAKIRLYFSFLRYAYG